MNELKVVGSTVVNGNDVKCVSGGFGENQKCILASDAAVQHEVKTEYINKLINNNISRFNSNDFINLKTHSCKEFVLQLGFTQAQYGNSKSIYLLSQRGYTKLVSMMSNDNDKKFEVMDNLIDNYFTMLEVINSDEQLKAMALLKAVESNGIESIEAIKTYSDLRIKEETKELVTTIKVKDKIIDDVIKDDGIYAINTIGKMLQSYNKQMGARKIFDYMRNKKILMDCKGRQNHNLPYSTYANYFDVKYVDVDFGMYNSSVPKVYFNGKGVKWFLNRLAKESYISKDDIKNIESNIAA